jgi:hypothetical protein
VTFVRGIWTDLVDKRLWPIAVALVVAAVAIPVLLHKQAASVPAAPAAQDAAGPRIAAGSSISLNTDHAQGLLVGSLHDPFHQLHVPKAATVGSTSTLGPAHASSGASTSAGQTGTGTPSSGGGSSGGGSSGGAHKPQAPASNVRVAFGKTGGSLRQYDLVPLTALSSASDPVLVFLGVQKDGKTAAFLVSSDASPQGDGHCSPSQSVCATLTVRAGDTVFIDVAGSGGNVQYELDVKRVSSS